MHLVGRSEEGHQGQEQVDDVQVEGDGGPDVLIICEALDDVVRVVDDVPTEDEGRQCAVDHLGDLAQWEKDLHNDKQGHRQSELYQNREDSVQVIVRII